MPAPSVSMQCSGGGAGEGLGGSKPHSTPRARGEANTPHVTRPHAQRRLHHFTSLSGGTEDCLDADAHHYTRLPPQTRQPARAGDPTSRAAALRSPSSRRRRDVAPRRVRHSASARPYCYVRASRPPCRPVRSLKRPAASRYRAYCYREGCSRGPLDGAKGGTKATPPLCAPLRASPPPRAAEAPAMTRTRAHAERGAAIRRPAPPAARRGERGWARGVSCGKEWRFRERGRFGRPVRPFQHAARCRAPPSCSVGGRSGRGAARSALGGRGSRTPQTHTCANTPSDVSAPPRHAARPSRHMAAGAEGVCIVGCCRRTAVRARGAGGRRGRRGPHTQGHSKGSAHKQRLSAAFSAAHLQSSQRSSSWDTCSTKARNSLPTSPHSGTRLAPTGRRSLWARAAVPVRALARVTAPPGVCSAK